MTGTTQETGLEELRAELAYLPSRTAWDESRKALASMRNDLGALTNRARRMEEALRVIRDKAGSHTVSHIAISAGASDPGYSGIYAVTHAALSDSPASGSAPDAACYTLPNGDCISEGPCMHSPASAARPAVTDGIDERAAFEKRFKHLDLAETSDAWGMPIYEHTHVNALWHGWQARAALSQSAPASMNGTQGDAVTSKGKPSSE